MKQYGDYIVITELDATDCIDLVIYGIKKLVEKYQSREEKKIKGSTRIIIQTTARFVEGEMKEWVTVGMKWEEEDGEGDEEKRAE